MDKEERDDLVTALVLEAGRLIEDISPELAYVLPSAQSARGAKLAVLVAASADATTLLNAAAVLDRHHTPSGH